MNTTKVWDKYLRFSWQIENTLRKCFFFLPQCLNPLKGFDTFPFLHQQFLRRAYWCQEGVSAWLWRALAVFFWERKSYFLWVSKTTSWKIPVRLTNQLLGRAGDGTFFDRKFVHWVSAQMCPPVLQAAREIVVKAVVLTDHEFHVVSMFSCIH